MDKKAVVIAGAGSTHTPGIIQSLLQKKNELPLRKLALYDIDEKRMHLVYDIMKQSGYDSLFIQLQIRQNDRHTERMDDIRFT